MPVEIDGGHISWRMENGQPVFYIKPPPQYGEPETLTVMEAMLLTMLLIAGGAPNLGNALRQQILEAQVFMENQPQSKSTH